MPQCGDIRDGDDDVEEDNDDDIDDDVNDKNSYDDPHNHDR